MPNQVEKYPNLNEVDREQTVDGDENIAESKPKRRIIPAIDNDMRHSDEFVKSLSSIRLSSKSSASIEDQEKPMLKKSEIEEELSKKGPDQTPQTPLLYPPNAPKTPFSVVTPDRPRGGRKLNKLFCTNCNEYVKHEAEMEPTTEAWVWCICLAAFLLWPLCLIPFCMESCKQEYYYCSRCSMRFKDNK